MKKTSVYLSEEEVAHLAELSRTERRPQAEIIREAIASYSPKGSPDRDFSLARAGRGPGGSVAGLPEAELLEGFGA
jgi:predicted DNA-binding protein